MPDNAIEKIMQAFDHPFPEILRPIWNFFHVPGGYLCEKDKPESHDPGHDHRVGDGETEWSCDLYGLLRKTFMGRAVVFRDAHRRFWLSICRCGLGCQDNGT